MDASNWINVVSVAVAGISVVWSINAWRASHLGPKRIELAEEVHELFLDCVSAINYMRSPMGYVGEGSTRKQGEDETPEQTEALNKAYVPFERLRTKEQELNRLRSKKSRFALYFGPEAVAPIDVLDDVISEVGIAARMLPTLWQRDGTRLPEEAWKAHLERLHRYEDIFWYTGGEDEIAKRLKAATADMERVCNEIVNPQKNIFAMLKRGMLWIERFLAIPERTT